MACGQEVWLTTGTASGSRLRLWHFSTADPPPGSSWIFLRDFYLVETLDFLPQTLGNIETRKACEVPASPSSSLSLQACAIMLQSCHLSRLKIRCWNASPAWLPAKFPIPLLYCLFEAQSCQNELKWLGCRLWTSQIRNILNFWDLEFASITFTNKVHLFKCETLFSGDLNHRLTVK